MTECPQCQSKSFRKLENQAKELIMCTVCGIVGEKKSDILPTQPDGLRPAYVIKTYWCDSRTLRKYVTKDSPRFI